MKIGFIGLAGSGKDEAARATGLAVERFAVPLKSAARIVFGADFDDRGVKNIRQVITPAMRHAMLDMVDAMSSKLALLEGERIRLHAKAGEWLMHHRRMSPREYQQWFGTECVRAVRYSAFCDRIANMDWDLAIPDVRFFNEASVADINVLIIRPGVEWDRSHESEKLAGELTECYLELGVAAVDEVIINDGTLDDLAAKVQAVIKR